MPTISVTYIFWNFATAAQITFVVECKVIKYAVISKESFFRQLQSLNFLKMIIVHYSH